MLDNNDEESVTFAPVDIQNDIFSDPSLGMSGADPSNGAAFAMAESTVSAPAPSSNGGGSSLLERIQQQRNQQFMEPVADPTVAPAPALAPVDYSNNASGFQEQQPLASSSAGGQFGYPSIDDTQFFSDNNSNNQPMDMNIPDYAAQSSMPDAYPPPETDYKETMSNILAAAGSLTVSAAKGVYRGTQQIYGKVMNKRSANGLASQQDRRAEMDYQRQSLLMDPHEMEDGVPHTSSMDAGLNTGYESTGLNSANQNSHPILNLMKQFCNDLKDIFLGLSRRSQLFVVLFFVFIVWLFISEEWSH